jgi:hypothetical protein
VADRTNLCSVSAVEEVVTRRRGAVLLSFARVVIWVVGISLALEYVWGVSPQNFKYYQPGFSSLAGGLLFGAGAVLNGGCSLRMLTRLGRGDGRMMLTILGLPIGAVLARFVFRFLPEVQPVGAKSGLVEATMYREWLFWMLAFWMLWEFAFLARRFRLTGLRERMLSREYDKRSSAALLGIANGILLAFVGTWMFTVTLIQSVTNLVYRDSSLYTPISSLLWLLLVAYLVGIAVSAFQARHLILQADLSPDWLKNLAGGVLMGAGASLVPGGNDILLLSGIPGLSAHGLPAYLSMLSGIAVTMLLVMRLQRAPAVT